MFEGTVDLDTLTSTFGGWYADETYTTAWDFTYPVTRNCDLYAKWTGPFSIDLSGQSGDHVRAKALSYIKTRYLSVATNYTIVLDTGNYVLPGISTGSGANINTENAVITLAGKDPAQISLSSNGSLSEIGAGELILDNNIILKGLSWVGGKVSPSMEKLRR